MFFGITLMNKNTISIVAYSKVSGVRIFFQVKNQCQPVPNIGFRPDSPAALSRLCIEPIDYRLRQKAVISLAPRDHELGLSVMTDCSGVITCFGFRA